MKYIPIIGVVSLIVASCMHHSPENIPDHSFVRAWYPEYETLRGYKTNYLAIPNWQMATGSGEHNDNIRVYKLSNQGDGIELLVDEPVYSNVSLYHWILMTSEISWIGREDLLIIRKELITGVYEETKADRTIIEVKYSLANNSREENVIRRDVIEVPEFGIKFSTNQLTHLTIEERVN